MPSLAAGMPFQEERILRPQPTSNRFQPIFTEGQLTGQAERVNEEATLMGTWDPWAILTEIAEQSINDLFAKNMQEGLQSNPPPEHWELRQSTLLLRADLCTQL